jgi:hypothetical protein
MNIRFPKGWSTHMPMLIRLVQMTDKPVLEIGSGLYSTPLLHWLCKERNVKLITYEDTPEYFKFAKSFQSRNHSIRFVEDWKNIDVETNWGVVLIDHHPEEQRGKDIMRLKDKADYFVLHDSEKEIVYGYDKVWEHFKYRYDWKDCKPWTTVLSNSKDLSFLQKTELQIKQEEETVLSKPKNIHHVYKK